MAGVPLDKGMPEQAPRQRIRTLKQLHGPAFLGTFLAFKKRDKENKHGA